MPRKSYFHKKKHSEESPTLKKKIKNILIPIFEVLFVIGAAYIISRVAFDKMKMFGNSMSPTIENGTVIVINKLSYVFRGPKRFDVVVFKQSNKEHSYFEVKRVIGLPGEKITMRSGTLYVNDRKIEEEIDIPKGTNDGLAEEGVFLGENEYFVLGDNRDESEDSRFASTGNILKSEIIGKAFIVEKPFGFVDGLNRVVNK